MRSRGKARQAVQEFLKKHKKVKSPPSWTTKKWPLQPTSTVIKSLPKTQKKLKKT
jgi:hypothetical protein